MEIDAVPLYKAASAPRCFMADGKQSRPKARTVRGFRDRAAGELAAERAMLDTIRRTYESYGFDALETPFLEYTDALGKFLPDIDRPNAGVFSFRDDDEQWVSLRYDLTAPLARYVAENSAVPAAPVPPLSDRDRVPQRQAGTGTLSRIHPVRRRHGRHRIARR